MIALLPTSALVILLTLDNVIRDYNDSNYASPPPPSDGDSPPPPDVGFY